MLAPVRIYCCYHNNDKESWENLESHWIVLKRNGQIETHDCHNILPGSNREQVLNFRLGTSDIVLLIISKYFLADDWCWNMMEQAMDKHQIGELKVVPILYSPIYYDSARFAELSMLPPGKPISKWEDSDEAYTYIAQRIGELVETLHKEKEVKNYSQESSFSANKHMERLTIKSFDATKAIDISQEGLEQ